MLSGVRSEMFDPENCKAREFIVIANVYGKKLNKKWPLANVIKPSSSLNFLAAV